MSQIPNVQALQSYTQCTKSIHIYIAKGVIGKILRVRHRVIISLKIYAHCAESSVLSIKYDKFCFDILDVCFM